MSSTRRVNKFQKGDDTIITETDKTFKTPFQTVGRPPVTAKNINDEYLKHPPKNGPIEFTDRRPPGKKAGAYAVEDTDATTGVLGEEVLGKYTKEAALGDMVNMVNEDTIHRNK